MARAQASAAIHLAVRSIAKLRALKAIPLQAQQETIVSVLGSSIPQTASASASLTRSLSLAHATLYGLGVTIGAGIYVLIGAAAARAGMHAPLAFVVAAALMALSAASFAELACRYPVAAGEAAYARVAFGSRKIATAVGLLVVAIALVSAAAISIGSAGYLSVFFPLPAPILVAAVVIAMGAIAAWGIKQSVSFAGIMTLIEIGGLLLLILIGVASDGPVVARLPEMIPSPNPALLAGLVGTVLLAVFAFIGFEGLANIAEEVRQPKLTLPRAIFLTLAISTLLYVCVVWVALITVGPSELAQSQAPLALVFERLTGASPRTMSAIAVIATLNGIIVQIIMASRVLYGLAHQGDLPAPFGSVSSRTHTPLPATVFATLVVLMLALALPLHSLAEVTSRLTLVVFTMVNLSLIVIKKREMSLVTEGYEAPAWAPWAGAGACLLLLALDAWFLVRS
ncbi:MAG: amino acid permease [Rhodospirillales bacterium]|nr:amino acid permease [Rhodospirillales bacterium]